MHRALGPRVGLTSEDIDALGGPTVTAGSFNDLERLVIQYAEEVTRRATSTPDLDRQIERALRTPRQIVELTIVVATANATTRISNALRIDEEV